MKQPSAYLKMRILGAIDYAQGKTIRQRIQAVAKQTFIDEDANHRSFTWRTISTWFYRYKSQGVTGVQPTTRKDKGKPRKITPGEFFLEETVDSLKLLFINGAFLNNYMSITVRFTPLRRSP